VDDVDEDFRTTTLARHATAHEAMVRGDPALLLQLWSHRDPVSLFGAWGPCHTGWARVARTLTWVGSRYSRGTAATSEVEVADVSGDLAYTVGYETMVASVDGATATPMRLRVTHIYRREDSEWRLVHRHADEVPQDHSHRPDRLTADGPVRPTQPNRRNRCHDPPANCTP
jgi:ketosteroid isomerase-like protein